MSNELKTYLEGSWKQVKGSVQEKWGKITDDKLDEIKGCENKLIGALQKEYALSEEQARKDLHEFLTNHKSK